MRAAFQLRRNGEDHFGHSNHWRIYSEFIEGDANGGEQ
jgi:hypothetical protein